MIRPFTCLAFLLACGSGLYLYQSKHRASVLDEQIAQTVKSTEALREQTRMVSAEWTLLNDPERLRQLASQFLTLQTVSPNQFTSLADLDSRLPAPAMPGPPAGASVDAVVAASSGPAQAASDGAGRTGMEEGKPADATPAEATPADATMTEASPPASPKDVSPPNAPKEASPPALRGASPQSARIAMTPAAEQSRPADGKPPVARVASVAAQPRPVPSQPRPPEQRGPEPVVAEARPMVPPPRVPAPAPMPQAGGSLLGMAHGMAAPPAPMPLPRPMPVSAPQQWSVRQRRLT